MTQLGCPRGIAARLFSPTNMEYWCVSHHCLAAILYTEKAASKNDRRKEKYSVSEGLNKTNDTENRKKNSIIKYEGDIS